MPEVFCIRWPTPQSALAADVDPMPEQRDDLRVLSARLMALHAALLEYARQDYEETHGPTKNAELLRLLIGDPHFAWLRPLSGIIAQIDEALDPREAREPAPDPRESADSEIKSFFEAMHKLLRSGEIGSFQTKYREALQRSPDVVMAHANVVKILPARTG